MKTAFAVWITGLPSAGKSTLARALKDALAASTVPCEVLESDEVRRVLTPWPTYSEEERDSFYAALAWIGGLLVSHGVPVIFDATGAKQAYRDRARREIRRFLEVYVDTPIGVCRERDPKGVWRSAEEGHTSTVPGAGVPYEPPEHADYVVRGHVDDADAAALRILGLLTDRGWL